MINFSFALPKKMKRIKGRELNSIVGPCPLVRTVVVPDIGSILEYFVGGKGKCCCSG